MYIFPFIIFFYSSPHFAWCSQKMFRKSGLPLTSLVNWACAVLQGPKKQCSLGSVKLWICGPPRWFRRLRGYTQMCSEVLHTAMLGKGVCCGVSNWTWVGHELGMGYNHCTITCFNFAFIIMIIIFYYFSYIVNGICYLLFHVFHC